MDSKIQQFREDLLTWGNENFRDFAWRETRDPYEVMIAEILLQRTRAETVEPIYENFLQQFPRLEDLGKAEQDEVAELLEPLGLHNRRASSLVEIGETLDESELPQTEQELLELPHVGKYVANAVLCFAHGKPRPIVDENVIRVYQRVFDIDHDRQRSQELWNFARETVPEESARAYNLAILDFAAKLCTSQNPKCEECFASGYCTFFNQIEE